ncbi:carbohydrate ABC transporter permease [Paenibacillus silvisoli]|uniref:carbohydrate ABC transporter permease n=1 Tax=Paenibacillus silvisoli TaxID=3110539 RepID=UPI002805DADF|nr:carbohydrate ABC transporter permease [Paenibacillus silvisoli]
MTGMRQTVRESVGDRLFLGLIYIFLALVLIMTLYPLVFILSSSFSSPAAVSGGRVWLWPIEATLVGYEQVLQNHMVVTGYVNSIVYTTVGTTISVVLTTMLAFPLSKKTFFGRNGLMVFIVFTMLFSGGLIPTYLVVRSVGLIDTRWALWLPNAIWVWQVIITRTFFQTSIPDELAEASEIDGCSDLRYILSVVIPLSKPILAVLALMYAVGQWNAYFDALIYLKTDSLFPLQLFLRSILIQNANSVTIDAASIADRNQLLSLMKYSIIVLSSLPILMIYPFVQRYFVQGMLIGSIKG